MFSTVYDAQMTHTRRVRSHTDDPLHGRRRSDRACRRHGVGSRVRVGRHRYQLDRELADGLPAAGSPERQVRAAQLSERRTRATLARSLRRIVGDAQSRRKGLSPLIAPAPGSVLPCEAAMLQLAERIDGDAPVAVAGLARARVLLVDARGPLYDPAAFGSLEAELLAIGEALNA
jgi:hypothetical protein